MEQKKIQRIIYSTKINATKISIKEQLLIIVVFRHRLDKKCNIGNQKTFKISENFKEKIIQQRQNFEYLRVHLEPVLTGLTSFVR